MISDEMNSRPMEVKICGLTRAEDVSLACEAGADYLGFIRADSKRAVPDALLPELVSLTQPHATAVLLYVNESREKILADVERCKAGAVQLHGNESPAFLHDLRQMKPELTLIKAFPVSVAQEPSELLENARLFAGAADVLLVDAPKGGEHPGDAVLVSVARELVPMGNFRVWLAGALSPERVAEVVPNGAVHGVDVARGVESAPGQKSAEAVRAFISNAKQILSANFPI